MSADKFREAGFKAIEQRKWPEAIDNLTKAIDQSKSPAWLLGRSQAFMETGQLEKAIADAEYAYCTAAERGNDKSRKQMIEAQYRRSVCFYRKKEYANADICAVWSQRLAKGVAVREAKSVQQEGVNDKGYYFATVAQAAAEEGDQKSSEGGDQMARLSALMGGGAPDKTPYAKDWNKAQIWRTQVLRFLEALPEDDPARKITIQLTPTKPSKLGTEIQPAQNSVAKAKAPATSTPAPTTAPAPDYSTFRTQFYQSDTTMTVSVFMKFASKEDMDKVEVRFARRGKFVVAKGVPRDPPVLFIECHDRISVLKSAYRVASMKLELTLVKDVPGKWPDFGTQSSSLPESLVELHDPGFDRWLDIPEGSSTIQAPNIAVLEEPGTKTIPESNPESKEGAQFEPPVATSSATTSSKAAGKAPAYPTSSKSGPKDWDNIADDDEEENNADVDSFFKKLYQNSTPEQQRAMMKSYTESNGTALSTDWSSVAKGKVETQPPTGMQEKKWGA